MQAIVTGGAIRVGKAISLSLAKHGYDIILIYNSSNLEAGKTAKEIEALGKKAYLYQCDISKKTNIDKLFAAISKEHKQIKLLVNNSSIFELVGFKETTENVFDSHMDINFKAPFFFSQHFVKYTEKMGIIDPNIINIADVKSSDTHNHGHFIYHITKTALIDLTLRLSNAFAQKVRVNCISPGVIISKEGKILPELDTLAKEVVRLSNSNLTGQNIFLDSEDNLV